MNADKPLQFLTAGSVDDGKSTLMGRLLFDAKAIMSDHLGALSRSGPAQAPDLALLTDGLEAEREQGITIDVAYRYFSTPKRKFILADAPGHEQYTRNMVTAASTSDAALVMVDVTKLDPEQALPDLLTQTRRHALLLHLLRVPHLAFAVNKMDAVPHPGQTWQRVSEALRRFAQEAGLGEVTILPMSALNGDNICQRMSVDWYQGPCLLEWLEGLEPSHSQSAAQGLHLPVQYVARQRQDDSGLQQRVLWGRVASGQVRVGDEVIVHPSGERARVEHLYRAGETVELGLPGQSVGLVLDRQVDVSRGDTLRAPEHTAATQKFVATAAWLDTDTAQLGRKYWLRHGHRWVQGRITAIHHCLDIHSLEPLPAHALQVNDIADVEIEVQEALPLSPYADHRQAGALIAVDPHSLRTSAALLVKELA